MTERRYGHVTSAVANTPWALLPEKLHTIVEILQLRAQGVTFTPEEIAARVGTLKATAIGSDMDRAELEAAARMKAREGSVAVIPVYGILAQRMNLFMAMSGGTSTQMLAKAFRDVMNDDSVNAVLFDIDSPGGSVFGTEELATEIYQARGRKPMVAIANSLMASAAYWIGAQADEVVITPSGMAGSVGVIAVHEDWSAANEMVGVKPTYLTYGKYKAEGNFDEPLSEEAESFLQGQLNEYGGRFVGAVAKARGVKAGEVLEKYGQGRVFTAKQALSAGMVDRIQTFEQVVARLGASSETRQPRAETDLAEIEAKTESTPESRATLERLWEIAMTQGITEEVGAR